MCSIHAGPQEQPRRDHASDLSTRIGQDQTNEHLGDTRVPLEKIRRTIQERVVAQTPDDGVVRTFRQQQQQRQQVHLTSYQTIGARCIRHRGHLHTRDRLQQPTPHSEADHTQHRCVLRDDVLV